MSDLHIENLSIRRGGRTVFTGLSCQIKAGQAMLLKGANGCGKSTLLRILAGLLSPSSGHIVYDGEILEGADIPYSQYALYLGHQNALKPVWTLRQNCDAFSRLMTGQASSEEALLKTADRLGLKRLLNQPVQYFSSGQKHRAALMRFGLVERNVWLMDEPTVGLDGANRKALASIMSDKIKSGGIILAATHDPISVDCTEFDVSNFTPNDDDAFGGDIFGGEW